MVWAFDRGSTVPTRVTEYHVGHGNKVLAGYKLGWPQGEGLRECAMVNRDDVTRKITVRDNTRLVPGTPNPYVTAATSANTRRTYRAAIRSFERWGGRLPTERDTLVLYLLAHATTLNPRTLGVHLTALGQWHRYQGINDPSRDPLVRKTLEGIRRIHGAPKRKAKALRLEHIAQIINVLHLQPEGLKKWRDLALTQVGFFGAFRRSELVAIVVEDLRWEPEGLIVCIPQSKTDQSGEGLYRALPRGDDYVCPATALRTWLDKAGITTGPVFRAINRWGHLQSAALEPGSINAMLKGLGEQSGFDFVPELSSHSFRRGLSTSAAREKIDFELIKRQGGWKSDATVWEYIEEGQRLTDNAALNLIGKVSELVRCKTLLSPG